MNPSPWKCLDFELQALEVMMSTGNVKKLNVRNLIIECVQSLKKRKTQVNFIATALSIALALLRRLKAKRLRGCLSLASERGLPV